jgi:hypothetical protein
MIDFYIHSPIIINANYMIKLENGYFARNNPCTITSYIGVNFDLHTLMNRKILLKMIDSRQ